MEYECSPINKRFEEALVDRPLSTLTGILRRLCCGERFGRLCAVTFIEVSLRKFEALRDSGFVEVERRTCGRNNGCGDNAGIM